MKNTTLNSQTYDKLTTPPTQSLWVELSDEELLSISGGQRTEFEVLLSSQAAQEIPYLGVFLKGFKSEVEVD